MQTLTSPLVSARVSLNDVLLRDHTLALRSHLADCRGSGPLGLRARCLMERLDSLLAPRLVTTVLAAAVVVASVAWV